MADLGQAKTFRGDSCGTPSVPGTGFDIDAAKTLVNRVKKRYIPATKQTFEPIALHSPVTYYVATLFGERHF